MAVVGVIVRGPQTADALVYTYAFEKGQTRAYEFTMRMKFSPHGIPGMPAAPEIPEGTAKGKMAFKAVDVRPDGSALLEITFSDMNVSFSGGTVDQNMDTESVRMLVGPTGEIRDVEGSGLFGGIDPSRFFGLPSGATGSALGSASFFPTFPREAIAPGDKWSESQKMPMPFGSGSIDVTSNGEHLGFENTSYGRAARMRVLTSMPIDIAFSLTDLLSAVGEAAQASVPEGLDAGRMVIKGSARGDMTALVPQNGHDLVEMIADMDMDFDLTMDTAALGAAAGEPQSFGMDMNIRMEMSRIS